MALHVELLEISAPGLAYIVVGSFVVAFSMVSLLVKERMYINEVVLGTAFGVLMGPHVANIFDPRSWGSHERTITLEVTRIVLATGLFAIGVELPRNYMAKHAKGLLIMVVPTMAFGWVVVAGILRALMPHLSYISCLAISACLTPTDPIICAAIVGGKFAVKHVPQNLRRILSAESAANDGLAYPFISISLYLTLETSRAVAIEKWILVGWLYQVVLGTLIGAVIGIAFSNLMKFTHRKGFIDRESYVAQYLALAFLTVGVCSTLGVDDLLAAFAAGSAISWDGHFNIQIENEVFSSVIDLVLNCACFVYIGAWLPFDSFHVPDLGLEPWRLVILVIAIMITRRIPSMLLLYRFIPEITTWREALFSGHFGPMGVGAIFISTLALIRLPEAQDPPQNQQELLAATLQPVVSFVVLASILIHGLSIPFFTVGRKVHSRTVSLSHTLTSRQNTALAPEWLLGVRRAAPINTSFSQPQVESGTIEQSDGDRLEARAHYFHQEASTHTSEESVPVLRGEDVGMGLPSWAAAGEASMVLEDATSRSERLSDEQKSIRASKDAVNTGHITPSSGAQAPHTVHFPSTPQLTLEGDEVSRVLHRRTGDGSGPRAPLASHSAGETQNSKTVHFPPKQ